jgi:hypothetical protein
MSKEIKIVPGVVKAMIQKMKAVPGKYISLKTKKLRTFGSEKPIETNPPSGKVRTNQIILQKKQSRRNKIKIVGCDATRRNHEARDRLRAKLIKKSSETH